MKITLDELYEMILERILKEEGRLRETPYVLAYKVLLDRYTKEEVDKIIDSSKSFFVDDDNIDSYIPSVVSLKEKKALSVNTKDLEKYRSSLRVYRINDTLVSVNKVNRLLGDCYDMYDAILYNMNLSNDEYENVISTLTPKTYHI